MTIKGTLDLIKDWEKCSKHVDHLERQLTTAQNDLNSSIKRLGKWLSPVDAELGEKFNVWHGNGLIEVKVLQSPCTTHTGNYKIRWRKSNTYT